MNDFALEVHLCGERRSIRVMVADSPAADAAAAAYVAARGSYCAMNPWEEYSSDVQGPGPLLSAALWPECEHGLSLQACYGPGHYMSAYEEQMRYGH